MIQVENYLMLSEYEQNLIKEIEGPEGVSTEHRAVRIVFFISDFRSGESEQESGAW